MEIWKTRVTFAHLETGKERVVAFEMGFADNRPMIDIVDEMVEAAYEQLPYSGAAYEMIYSDEEQVS